MKGRDWYDFIWYITHKIPLNLNHLRQRLIQTQAWDIDAPLTASDVSRLLDEKIQKTDFNQAKSDITPFIHDTDALMLWSADFFAALVTQLIVV